jgi:PAS domain S-box-containing protein
VLRAAQLARRLQASEAELRASEQRISLAADAAELGMWVWDTAQDELWTTDRLHALLGFRPGEAITLASFLARLYPEDREPVQQALRRSLEDKADYTVEFRVLLPEGGLRWIAAKGRVEDTGPGEAMRMLGACIDITERRQAEDAAHALSGRLIHAQEAERMRLARELHDDLSQNLALLSIELEMVGQRPPVDPEQVNRQMQALSVQVKRLSSDVHRLSHELHPSKLEQLGLVAAMHGFCRELAAAYDTAIEFEHHDVPRSLPKELALCLYRITQEALQNVVKHSGATTACVTLTGADNELRLAVTDDGQGFDPQAAQNNGSLGLISMHERVRLVRGRLSVESRPGEGTRVEVRIPIAVHGAGERAA